MLLTSDSALSFFSKIPIAALVHSGHYLSCSSLPLMGTSVIHS
ncbi:hypothetical protein [Streptococcus pyogenes SSI-1]|nr:hypothetical protein [Streptococcus pyogenes SSI-1]